MFNMLNKVRIYKKALELLAEPDVAAREVLVHDYNAQCYRTDQKYTVNGLHWGYPDAIVESITGEDPDGTPSPDGFLYAGFADKMPAWHRDNSRFSSMPYCKIKKIVEHGIREKLQKAEEGAKEEVEVQRKWLEVVNTTYKAFDGAAVRLQRECDADAFRLIVLKPERFVRLGFGNFLEKIEKGDVSMDADMPEVLRNIRTDQSGLFMFEGWAGAGRDTTFGGMFDLDSVIPVKAANCQKGFATELSKLATIQ